ncbi:MAG: radical SAM protein [Pseudomonadota bacterium]
MIDSKKSLKTIPITDHPLWKKTREKRTLLYLSLEFTARCNNNCSHCYVNLPENDAVAIKKEMTLGEIKTIVDEAVELGCLWVHITGGEPLLRTDFIDIYLYLKKKGLLITLFTNASLISDEHIKLFKQFPPRDIEISVYGMTPEIHRKVTRETLFKETCIGIEKIIAAKLPVTLKTTILKSNFKQLDKITTYCKDKTKSQFRFDPFLHLRVDKDEKRNKEIRSQRLKTKEIIELEKNDPDRIIAIKKRCSELSKTNPSKIISKKIFKCDAGINSCYVGYDGTFKLCSSLTHKHCTYDLKNGSLSEAWKGFAPSIMSKTSDNKSFKENCMNCDISSFCLWCPANADLEIGELDGHVQYFCDMTKERFQELNKK